MNCNLPGSSVLRISRQEHWSELPFPSPGDLPDPGIEPRTPALAGRFFTTEPPVKPLSPSYRWGNRGSVRFRVLCRDINQVDAEAELEHPTGEFSGCLVVRTLNSHRVQSLVRELKCPKPHSMAKKRGTPILWIPEWCMYVRVCICVYIYIVCMYRYVSIHIHLNCQHICTKRHKSQVYSLANFHKLDTPT